MYERAVRAPTLVLDLTPLDTDSRLRGFGRYVLTLARGIAALPASERAGMRLLGLTHLGWDGSYRVIDRLDSWSGEANVKRDDPRQHLLWAYRRRVALSTALRRIGADAVHLLTPDATPLAMWLAGGCKKVVTCHDLIDLRWPDHYLPPMKGGRTFGPMILRRRYTSADHIVAISDESANDLKRFFGIAPEKITRVYNSIDHAKWTATPGDADAWVLENHGLSDGRYLVYVGDLDWRKNAEGMISGLSHARRSGAGDVALVLCGQLNDAKRTKVLRLAAEAGVSDAVKLVGFVSDADLAALYRRSLAHLFVSRDEGFGLTVIEAMACGAPVITTRSGSLGEVAGEDALLCDPEDPAAIGDAIARLAGDPMLRDHLREAGISRAARFTVERQARETVAVYRRVLGV